MDLLILGARGHGGVVREVAEATGNYDRIAFLDDHGDIVVGKLFDYEKYIGDVSHAFITIGNPTVRNQWQDRLVAAGFEIPVLVHSDSYISPSAEVGIRTVIMPKAVVQSNMRIGKGCIISAGVIVDHDAEVGDYCHINVRAVVAAGSKVPDGTKVDYREVYRGAPQVAVADKDLEDKHKRDFGTESSFF